MLVRQFDVIVMAGGQFAIMVMAAIESRQVCAVTVSDDD